MKTLTTCGNPSSNPLQIACCGIQEATCDYVNCSVSRRWFWSVLRNSFSNFQVDYWLSAFSKDEELRLTFPFEFPPVLLGGGRGGGDSHAASGFLNNKDAKKNLKTISAYTESTDLIFKTLKKICSFLTLSLLPLPEQRSLGHIPPPPPTHTTAPIKPHIPPPASKRSNQNLVW